MHAIKTTKLVPSKTAATEGAGATSGYNVLASDPNIHSPMKPNMARAEGPPPTHHPPKIMDGSLLSLPSLPDSQLSSLSDSSSHSAS